MTDFRIYKFKGCESDYSNTVINKNPVTKYYLPVYLLFTPLISNETLMNGGFQNAYKQRDVRILKLLQKHKEDRGIIF